VKTKASSLSKVEQFEQLKVEAVEELLEKRKELKRQWAMESAKFEQLLEENAKELAKLGHRVKDSKVNLGKNLRLTDEQIKAGLEVILSGKKQLSLPSILQNLKIARSRFAEWEKRNPSVVEYHGNGKSRVYVLSGGKQPRKH
jgi:hypothetical protein